MKISIRFSVSIFLIIISTTLSTLIARAGDWPCWRGTGREAWRRVVVRAPLEEKHPRNSHASSTPAADGQLIYVPFLDRKNVALAAFDFDGREAWRSSPGEFYCKHGFCSSPVLFEDLEAALRHRK